MDQREAALMEQTEEEDDPLFTAGVVEPDREDSRTLSVTTPRDERSLLESQFVEFDRQEEEIRESLECIDELRDMTAGPLESRLLTLTERQKHVRFRLQQLRNYKEEEERAKREAPPGPTSLRWVESTWFHALCMTVIMLNMLEMFQATSNPTGIVAQYSEPMDLIFLAFYSFELMGHVLYHQRKFLIGPPLHVCWNYMDTIIVVAGTLELLFKAVSGGTSLHISALRMLRLFRVLRLLRLLKVLKELEHVIRLSGPSWIDGPRYEKFMGFVIWTNSAVMWLEVDFAWSGWVWVENVFLLIYTLEVVIKLRVYGLDFFTTAILEEARDLHISHHVELKRHFHLWNILDFLIAAAGVLDLWMMPLLAMMTISIQQGKGLIMMLRTMRIVRIVRLVRLLRSIKPLHNLVVGVGDSMAAMFWVAVLAVILMYILAIVFTNFTHKGYFLTGQSDKQVVQEVQSTFGSVPESMFHLFKLMNDDLSTADGIVTTNFGRFLFVITMVLLNWSMLAVLTSVISSTMIDASQRAEADEKRGIAQQKDSVCQKRLIELFQRIDTDNTGFLNEKEWHQMTSDPEMCRELVDSTGMDKSELADIFESLCDVPDRHASSKLTDRHASSKLLLSYAEMIKALMQRQTFADKRGQLNMIRNLKAMDSRMNEKLSILSQALSVVNPLATQSVNGILRRCGSAEEIAKLMNRERITL